MSQTLDLPVALASAPFDPVGKTVAEVVDQVSRVIRRTEIQPEWVSLANLFDDANQARYGLHANVPWPEQEGRRRLSLSVERGNSEGWIIHVDTVHLLETGETSCWHSQPLMRIKTLSRSQAWSIAAVVSRLLDID
jgi:hypothetical protein